MIIKVLDLADPVTKPETVDTTAFSIALGGDAVLLRMLQQEKGKDYGNFHLDHI